MKPSIFPLALASLLIGTTSCNDFLDQYSQDLVVAKTVQDLNELLIGDVYLRSQTVSYGMSQGVYAFVNLLDDDINTTLIKDKNKNDINTAWRYVVHPMFGYFTWQQDVRYNYGGTSNPEDNATWNKLYQRIAHANNIIDIIDEMPHETDDDKRLYHRVKGEAHFLRGQFYFALANLYGHAYRPDSAATDLCVPLKLTPHVEHVKNKETQFTRATVQAVYDQVVADLTLATEELTLSPQLDRYRLHRASAEAAGLLLSRVHLYRQDWAAAEAAAKAVMESRYCRIAALAEVAAGGALLRQGSTEVIFSQGANYIAPRNKGTSLSGDAGDFCVSSDLYSLFDDNDVRKPTFFSPNVTTDSISLSGKYERGLELNHVSDGFALRAAEAYLNYAEACAMQQKTAEANRALNALRTERILDFMPETHTGAELVQAIRDERRRELCFEGHRWFDLRRYQENKLFPFAKTIQHVFNVYSDNNYYVTTHRFLLPPGDPAYTFAIPPKAIEFDKVPMPNNPRHRREEVKIEKPIPLPPIGGDEEGSSDDSNGDTAQS